MSDAAFNELEAVLELDDDELKAELPNVIGEAAADPESLLLSQPTVFRELSARVSTLEGMDEYAAEEPETVESFLDLLWNGLELISEHIDQVADEITQKFSVSWAATDSDVAFHMETDPDEGRISGGSGELESAELTFNGETDVILSMLGDDEFDSVQAFMQGRFQIDGPIPKAQQLGQVMESALSNVDASAADEL